MANPLFKQARRSIRDVRKANAADLRGDTAATQSQLAAIFGNLATAGAGTARTLTKAQNRELDAIQRLAGRTNARASAGVARTRETAVARYGSAMGGAVDQGLGVAEATAKGTKNITRARTGAASVAAKGGVLALDQMREGTAQAQAGADYALAVALRQRGQTDAAQVAEMQFQLAQQKLQFQQQQQMLEAQTQADFALWKKKLDYENSLAEDEQRVSLAPALSAAPNAAAVMASYGLNWPVLDPETGEPTGETRRPTAAELAQQYATEAGILEGDVDRFKVVQEIAQNMLMGMGAVEASQTAMATLYGSTPGFNVDSANETIMTAVRAQRSADRARLTDKYLKDPSSLTQQELDYLDLLMRSAGLTPVSAGVGS
jgi:hypothetical protein